MGIRSRYLSLWFFNSWTQSTHIIKVTKPTVSAMTSSFLFRTSPLFEIQVRFQPNDTKLYQIKTILKMESNHACNYHKSWSYIFYKQDTLKCIARVWKTSVFILFQNIIIPIEYWGSTYTFQTGIYELNFLWKHAYSFFFKGKTWKLIFSDGVANYRFMSTRWLFFLRIVPNKLIDQTGWRRSRELNLQSSGREHAMYILALIATLLQEKDALFNAHFSII